MSVFIIYLNILFLMSVTLTRPLAALRSLPDGEYSLGKIVGSHLPVHLHVVRIWKGEVYDIFNSTNRKPMGTILFGSCKYILYGGQWSDTYEDMKGREDEIIGKIRGSERIQYILVKTNELVTPTGMSVTQFYEDMTTPHFDVPAFLPPD
jgi:hypothetical protein